MKNLFWDFDEVLEATLDFGVPLPKQARVQISRKLETLSEKLPIQSNIDLQFYLGLYYSYFHI